MEKEYEASYHKILEAVIRKKALRLIAEDIKINKSYKYSVNAIILSILAVIVATIILNSIWAFIPIVILYYIYDIIREYRFIKRKLPAITLEIIENTQEYIISDLKDIKEDLDIKSASNIYNKKDIKEKKSEIEMLEITNKILTELRNKI